MQIRLCAKKKTSYVKINEMNFLYYIMMLNILSRFVKQNYNFIKSFWFKQHVPITNNIIVNHFYDYYYVFLNENTLVVVYVRIVNILKFIITQNWSRI